MVKVNVATLKAELSKYLDMVQSGEQIIVTSHGQEISKIGPAQLVNSSPINWADFKKQNPGIKPKKKGTSAVEMIRQLRDED